MKVSQGFVRKLARKSMSETQRRLKAKKIPFLFFRRSPFGPELGNPEFDDEEARSLKEQIERFGLKPGDIISFRSLQYVLLDEWVSAINGYLLLIKLRYVNFG